MMRAILLSAALPLLLGAVAPTHVAGEAEPGRAALLGLLAGNVRFATRGAAPHRAGPKDLAALARSQRPRAVVVGCADSRVPPELIFDQGLGDLFVVRVAGNTAASDAVAGSVRYGVEHLHAPLVLVLGHERCGAVGAVFQGAHTRPAMRGLLHPVAQAVAEVPYADAADAVDAAVDLNVRRTVEHLRRELKGRPPLLFAGARYDLDTGRVALIEVGP